MDWNYVGADVVIINSIVLIALYSWDIQMWNPVDETDNNDNGF